MLYLCRVFFFIIEKKDEGRSLVYVIFPIFTSIRVKKNYAFTRAFNLPTFYLVMVKVILC